MIDIVNCGEKSEGLLMIADIMLMLSENPTDANMINVGSALNSIVSKDVEGLNNYEIEAFALSVWNKLADTISGDNITDNQIAGLRTAMESIFGGICDFPTTDLVIMSRNLSDKSSDQVIDIVDIANSTRLDKFPVVQYAIRRCVLEILINLGDFEFHKSHIRQIVDSIHATPKEISEIASEYSTAIVLL